MITDFQYYYNLSGFTIMLLFRKQFTTHSDSFFNASSNVSLFLNATEIELLSAKL